MYRQKFGVDDVEGAGFDVVDIGINTPVDISS